MNGKHLVIGLVLFIIIIVAAIYFSITAEFNKDRNIEKKDISIIEHADVDSHILNI